MPGYSQLKKLSDNLLKLGNEIKLRADRGEKAVPYPVPDTIPDIDDSQDFVAGLPEKPKPPEPEEPETPEQPAPASDGGGESEISVDSILGSIAGDGVPDLSAFDTGDSSDSASGKGMDSMGLDDLLKSQPEEKEPEPPPKPKGISGSGYSGFGFDDDGNLEEDEKQDSMPDIGALMGGPGKKAATLDSASGLTGSPDLDAILNPQKKEEPSTDPNPDVLAGLGLGPEPEIPVPQPKAPEPVVPPKPASPKPQAKEEEKPSEPKQVESSPSDTGDFDLGDFGLDGIEVEEYTPPSQEEAAEPQGAQIDADALFGEDVDQSGIPEKKEEPKPKPVYKPLPVEEDLAILKPDIFTENPVTKENPPYYAEGPFAQMPIQKGGQYDPDAGKEKEEPVLPKKSAGPDINLDEIPVEDYTPPKETSSGGIDFNLDDLGGLDDLGDEFSVEDVTPMEEPATSEDAAPIEDASPIEEAAPIEEEIPSLDDFSLPEEDSALGGTLESHAPIDEAAPIDEGASLDEAAPIPDDFSLPEDDFASDGAIDLNMDLPEGLSDVPPEVSEMPSGEGSGELDSGALENAASDFDFDLPDDASLSFEQGADEGPQAEGPGVEETSAEQDGAQESSFDMDVVPDTEISAEAVESPKSDEDIFNTDGMDFASFDMDGPSDAFGEEPSGDSVGFEMPPELQSMDSGGSAAASDGSSLDDFSIPDTDSQLSKASDDFALEGGGDDDFNIPGFSEEGADPYAASEKKGGLDQVDFTGGLSGDGKQRTSLTEGEYEKFKKNLSDYPLNVRIAVEDMIAKNEFTDEVVFEVIDKVLKKVTARQLAGHLEKMLDISLPVPRDYERRSAEEYEAYKASFAYQLKSRILPAIIFGLLAAMILFCLGYLGHRYVYKPLKAESIYKEGYTLLERDEYPQSEMKFNEALKYKSKKKWFFKYAQGYRAHKQYDRAELFYKNILVRFHHDKQAGLEYADMQVKDLANYEKAEQILKREVLDNHVNDADAILALGDTYLEWATESDSSKFQDAYEQYSKLQQLYGSQKPDLYQSRFLRYNIRTDQFRNVLELKEYFFPREKSLGAEDWTELSGYLLDKQYGPLPNDQEFLRDKIEDVRDMMLFAIKASPEDPVANYNLSRYLVQVGDHTKAKQSLLNTEMFFEKASNLNRKNIYRQINTYRLLGEEYLYDREYILAQTTFTRGLDLFENRQNNSNFAGDENVGIMYSDMGNLDYFISGDLESARRNYDNAIKNKHDTPSIRYRVGYIDYSNNKLDSALNNFIKASQEDSDDTHLMLALGNTLSLKNDNYVAQGYYNRLLDRLDLTREKYGIVQPQTDERAGDMVELYMKTSNNLGVSLFRIARQSGSSSMNAASLVNFQNSLRYYDAMTRDQKTMLRLPGSNLAEMNLRYATVPFPNFEPEIYTEIPRVLDGEKGLEQ